MHILILVVVTMLISVVQAIMPVVNILGHAKPPLLLGVVIYYALGNKKSWVIAAAILAGLLHDTLSHIPFGVSSLAFTLIGLTIHSQQENLFTQQWITSALLGAVSGFVLTVFLYLVLVGSNQLQMAFVAMLVKAVGVGLIAVLTTPVVCGIIRGLEEKLGLLKSSTGEIY